MAETSHRRLVAIATALLAITALLAMAGSAEAALENPFGARIKSFSGGPSDTQAGGHPDLQLDFGLTTRTSNPLPEEAGSNSARNVLWETPAGFTGNPHSVDYCTLQRFLVDLCPPDSQIGLATPNVVVNEGEGIVVSEEPLYNLVPAPGQAGLLGFKGYLFNFPTYIVIHARTGSDFGLDAEARGVTNYFALYGYHQTIWGVPASPIHDAHRYAKGGFIPMEPGIASNLPERPFLTMPTTCGVPLTSRLETLSYDGGRDEKTIPWPTTTGCDQLSFNPSLSAKPSTSSSSSPSGLDVILKVPQSESPNTPTSSEAKANVVTTPPGFSINPSAADGKESCSDQQAHVGLDDAAECPEHAKVGTVTLDSWTLPGPISGGIYLGEPKPGDRYRLVLTADGYGTHIKLLGSVKADPQTGQLVTTFDNLPQAPYTEFDLHFFGSERGLLATPTKCGTYPVKSEFVPWASELPNQTSTQFFTIDSGPGGGPCPGDKLPFTPSFRAAAAGNAAGTHNPFSVNIQRPDGDQYLSTVGVKTPPGFTATLKGIPPCADSTLDAIADPGYSGVAERAAPKCPAASQVGTVSAGAGAGSRPVYVNGKVYLAGPYKGAPLSFAIVTPAVSGPYDLGNVVNRVAIHVDPVTAAVTATSDPLPQIIDGIPLRLRSVLINLDRPSFTLNPTNCSQFDVTGLIGGEEGAAASPTNHFQVANCDSLGFEPKLTTVLKGGTKRTAHPALTATLTQDSSGESNISRAVVTLPRSEFLDQAHIGTICTRVQFAAEQCPAASIYGKAKAFTPLLDQPLEGPVYLRSSSHTLPDLVAALKGPASQPIEIDLAGRIDSKGGGIRTTFESIPDQPVSRFVLQMKGGKKGLLQNSKNICKDRNLTQVKLVGQNDAVITPSTELTATGCDRSAKRAGATKKERLHR